MGIHSRKLPLPRRFYNPSDIFSKLGLSQGRKLKPCMVVFSTTYVCRLDDYQGTIKQAASSHAWPEQKLATNIRCIDIIICPTKYGWCDYMNPSTRQAIQHPTASDRQRIATGLISELILLQTVHDGWESAWWNVNYQSPQTNKNEVNSRYKLIKSVEYINGFLPT